MLTLLLNPLSRSDLFDAMDLTNQSRNRAKFLDPLLSVGWVAMEFPNELTHPGQTYYTTASGKRILNLINHS